jgi:NAD(P)-dependent dehydrogenase (short-subunit alcohol dehydrogenase family)
MSGEAEVGSVVVAGVGPGLGLSLARAFAAEGYRVGLLARDPGRMEAMAQTDPERLLPLPADVTNPDEVARAFATAERELGPLACAVFNAGAFAPGGILETSPEEFERCWRVGAFAGFLVGQAAARLMLSRGRGTVLFTGATASLRGSARFANLASPKFALRALAQSMARELGPRGIHVAHVIVDGQIRSPRYASAGAERGPDSLLEPDAIAALYVQLHRQERSCWTHEADVRPWSERF